MIEQELRKDMYAAASEDRERFFAVADTLHLQPKYAEYVTSGGLEVVKQQWRDMTSLLDYPNIDWPMRLPEWFPKVRFASSWKKDVYIISTLQEYDSRNKDICKEENKNGYGMDN